MDNSYKDMAKSSGIVAFVQIFQMAFSLLRNKLVALFIGASGFGIWSLFQTFMDMAVSFSTFGLDQGGVREIAKSSSDKTSTSKCIFAFRVAILSISIIFSIIILCFAEDISQYIFKTSGYAGGIRILAITLIFYGISKGGYAILNGLHALKSLAISQVISSVSGSIGAILIIYFCGENGIPYALSVVIVVSAIITSHYIKKQKIGFTSLSWVEFRDYVKKLMYLGLGFTIAGIVSTVMTMMSKSYLNLHYDLDTVGIYQASWTISNLYIGIILSAMGIDFMPRLSKVSSDDTQMNLLINQQIQFGMSLASIGGTLVLLFSPLILLILYSSEFVTGVSIIRWQFLGVVLRVVAFPFSYSIMAKGKPIQYATIQVIFWITDYLLLRLFSSVGGFDALGINYFVAYILYLLLTCFACVYNHNFRLSKETKKIVLLAMVFICLFWILCLCLDGIILYIVGMILWCIQFYFTNKYINQVMKIDLFKFVKSKLLRK